LAILRERDKNALRKAMDAFVTDLATVADWLAS
jgi:hypothetical protein